MEGILSQLQPPPGPGTRAKQERMAVRRLRVNEVMTKRKQDEMMEGMSKSSVISLGRSSMDLFTSTGTKVSVVAVTEEGTEPEEYDSITVKEKKHNANAQLDHQIEESKRQLEQLIKDGEILITNVKAAAEYREKIRHDKQDETRKQRIATLNDDAEQCQQKYEEISQKWLINAEKTLPLELFEKMKQQQEACDDLLRKKDDTILSLKREIEENDYEYENNLEKYQKDMILMGDRVDDHIDDLRKSFLEELELIEDYTCQDRQFVLEENQSETVGWLKVLSDFETMEVNNLENKKVVTVAKFQIISDLYTAAKQGFRNTKHALENDLRILIQEVEQIKVICQMNLDKMDYNLHVLRRREDKNRQTKNAMKRKLLKLQDQFSEKTTLYKNIIVDAANKSNKLIKEINRLQDQCKNGSRKTLELVTNDYYKYMEMWIVNEETAREKLQKLVDSEKFIYETQLGIELPVTDVESLDSRPYEIQRFMERIHYVPPNLSRKRSDLYERYNDDFGSDADGSEQSITALKDQETVYKTIGPADPENDEADEEEEEVIKEDAFNPKVLKGLLKQISKICDHTGFIIEEKLRRIVAPLQDLEQQNIRTDSLFQALGITNVAQLEILAKYVAKHCKIMKTFTSKSRSEGADTSVDKLFDTANKEVRHTDVHPSSGSEAEAGANRFQSIKSANAREEVAHITKTIENELGIEFDDNGDIIDQDSKEFAELSEGELDEDVEEEENTKRVKILIEAEPNDDKVENIIKDMTDEQVHEAIHLAAYPSMYSPTSISSSGSSFSSSTGSSTSSSYVTSCGSTTDAVDSQTRNEIRLCKEEKERIRGSLLERKDPGEAFDVGEGQISVWTEPDMRAAKLSYQKDVPEKRHKKKSKDYSTSSIVAISSIQDTVETVDTQVVDKHDVHHDLDHQHQHHQHDHDHHEHHHHHDHDHQEHHHEHHHHHDQHHDHDHDQHHDHHHEHHDHGHHHDHHHDHGHHHDHHHDHDHHHEHRHSQADHRYSHSEHRRSHGDHRHSHADRRHSHADHRHSHADHRHSHADHRRSHADHRHSHGEHRRSHADHRHSHPEHRHHRHHHVEEEFSDESPENDSSTEDAVVSSTPSETTSSESIVEVDTTEIAYIEPSDILTALTEFCQDFNSEIKMEIPTEEDIISKKLSLMQFPDASDTAEYWNRFYTLTDPKSKELWESIQYCFEQYSDALKKRNALVEEVTHLHQQNFELSHLLKKHMQRGVRFGSQPGGAGNIDLPHLPYC